MYIASMELAGEQAESSYLQGQKMTVYDTYYPFGLFTRHGLKRVEFAPLTVFYGSNGSGKSTLLNVIAEKSHVRRLSAFNRSDFFSDYVDMCEMDISQVPDKSLILTSDDVFEYALDLRYVNEGISRRRAEIFDEYTQRKYAENRFCGLDDYERWLVGHEAKTKTKSRFTNERVAKDAVLHSNGENAMEYFVRKVEGDALYLLDEPENSLSVSRQIELASFLRDSVRFFGCQIIMATHSPIMLSIRDARIYDMDSDPVMTRKWTELENVRKYYDFFREHEMEFEQ